MTTRPQNYATQANHRLITQVAEYYNSTKEDIEFYRDLNAPILETLSTKHLQHWKEELHKLIFNGINCRERSL